MNGLEMRISSSSIHFHNFVLLITLLIPTPSLSWITMSTSSTASPIAVSSSPSFLQPQLDQLAKHANAFASAHGIQVERRVDDGSSSSIFVCAPMSLLPNAYPKESFQQAQKLAAPFNELVERVSQDGDFLANTLGHGVLETDPYTAKLLQLYQEIYIAPTTPNVAKTADRLGIHRSDYMLNERSPGEGYRLQQVELNTISASFGGLSVQVANLHRHLVSRFSSQVSDFLGANIQAVLGINAVTDPDGGVPENPALSSIPKALSLAHERYQRRFHSDGRQTTPVVLMVVQEGETNTVDQRMLEFQLWEAHGVRVVRMSLTKANTGIELDEETGALLITGTNLEVSVVYYRAGYGPADYPDGYDGIEWQSRAKLEKSRATKCPSLGYHLAGTKKVQQELARPDVLERFFPTEPEKAALLRTAFAGLYSLGDDATVTDFDAVRQVLNGQQDRFVLKPQREGGGFNFYSDRLLQKIRDNLETGPSGELQLGKNLGEYILMERLFPPQQQAVLLRSGLVEGSGDSISELGCFGTILVTPDGEVPHNEYAGFLLRTKFSNVDEGGVNAGFATLSSPYLC